MRTYKIRLSIVCSNPLMNDLDVEQAVKNAVEEDSDLFIKQMTIIED